MSAPPELERELRLAQARFAGIVEIAADAIISVDHDGAITFFNEGAERIFGWSAGEVVGQRLEVLLPERYRARHAQYVAEFGASQDIARRMGHRREISGLRRGGEEFPAEASISKFTVDGRVTYNVVLRDITERVQLFEREREAVRARDELISLVSHDLRNPVNAIKMIATSLLRAPDAPSPAQLEGHLRTIDEAARQCDALIQDLLDVSRIEAGRLRVELQPTDLAALVRGALDVLAPLAHDRGLALVVDVDDNVPLALVDEQRLAQVLSNLVGNAIKFTPPGGTITVRVPPASRDARELLVEVRDTGPGIAPDDLPHVFDRYWQGTRAARRAGAGLGLPIAKGIVEAHGGRLWVESGGGGSVFGFTVRTS